MNIFQYIYLCYDDRQYGVERWHFDRCHMFRQGYKYGLRRISFSLLFWAITGRYVSGARLKCGMMNPARSVPFEEDMNEVIFVRAF